MNSKIKRNKQIQKLHKEDGWSYQMLADRFKISRARAWQVSNDYKIATFFCEKHKKKYVTECPFCRIDNHYDEVLRKNGDIKDEIEKLRQKDRDEQNVRKRKILVTRLHDDFNFSFLRIGQLLQRHYTSIIYLYDSYKKERSYKNKNK